jgi:serine/threonine-protein kinase
MGMVYRAEHTQLGKPAALKMLLPQFSSDPTIVQRFFNEARAASAIDHPGIVEISDFGTQDGAAYIVMALLKGESLEHRLQRGPIGSMEGASIVAQVLGAIAAAHARGIIHRDLKPDNIFLTPNDLMPNGIQVKLLDFGIAKLAGDSSGGFKTQTGMMMGTPAYMSPEQCMGRADLDHRTDLYAIGCILFHVLTGRPPFTGEGGTGMMIAAHMRDPAPHPRSINPNIPDNLAAIVMRLLEKDPNARYQSATETRQALVEAGASAPSKPPTPADQYAATMPPQMYTASSYGTAPTTASGSAAQQVPMTTHAPAKSKTGLLLGVAVLAAAGLGVGVWAAMRGDKSETTAKVDPPPVGSAAPVGSGSATTTTEVQPAGRPVEKTAAVVTTDQTPCPLGKVRGFDTHGQCCWPEQAFSTAKVRCVGTPSCPAGHKANGEDCIPTVAVALEAKPVSTAPPPPHGGGNAPPPPPPDDPKPVKGTVEAPTFKLDQQTYAPGQDVAITFASPIASTTNNRSWVTIVEASRPNDQYGDWTYVADGATTAKLTAPSVPGSYEVRLHTNYPTKSTNVRQKVSTKVVDAASPAAPPKSQVTSKNDQRFMLANKVAKAGDSIEITFPVAMKALDGEKFWITIVTKGAADSAYGTYAYVTDGARTMQFEMPSAAGDYEIRLHANYPTKSTNLVHKAPIRVED